MTWRTPLLVGLVALLVGAALGWRLRPDPAPKVEVRVRELSDEEKQALTKTVTTEGPERHIIGPTLTIEKWRTVVSTSTAPGCPACICSEHSVETSCGLTVLERGPLRSETSSASRESDHREVSSSSVTTPQPLPRWSVAGGVQSGLDLSLRPYVGGGLRLLGPVWVELVVLPLSPAAAVGLRVTF